MPNLTRKEIMRLFYRATMAAIGEDPDKKYGTSKPPVRLTYSTFGKPDWTVNDDVIFLTFHDAGGDDTTQPIHEVWEDAGRDLLCRHYINRVLQISFTAYGPNGYDHLLEVKHAFLDGSDVLRKAGIMIIPSAETPQYVPENYQNMWWDRADLTLRFNYLMHWDEDVKAIEKVPVTIHANPPGESHRVQTDSGIIIKKG